MDGFRISQYSSWLSIPSTLTYFLLIILQTPHLVLAHGLFSTHGHLHHGIPTNVTKHLHFPNFNPNPTTNHIKLLGSATISKDEGFIQIPDPSPTLDHAYKAGRAIFSSPIRLFDPLSRTPASFNTTFSFLFTSDRPNGGDGLAFVIVPDEFSVGRPGPWLGILNDACDHYKVFAVEFDTVQDPEVGDPNDDHVGINLGSIVSFMVANSSQLADKLTFHDHHLVHRAWIMYDGNKKWIEIYLGLDGEPFSSEPILSSRLNLAPFLNEYMFVGFSASTGKSTQIHHILSWNFSSTIPAFLAVHSRHICHKNVARQVSKYYASRFSHSSNPPSSFLIFVCVLGLISMALFTLYCNSTKPQSESSLALVFPDKRQRPVPPTKLRRFNFGEVYRATRRFSKAEILAMDLKGVLYKGTLPSECHVAVKRFSTKFLNSSCVDWRRTVKRISSINTCICQYPTNLASIRGWCYENREMIIVYDYHANGSLDRWLLRGLGVLPWTRRLKIIKDVAKAVSFLHSKEVPHGNLKTSSVFLDVTYRAILGDYELVHRRQSDLGKFELCSGKRSDVFGFGMLVLEIVAGKRTIEAGDIITVDKLQEMSLLRHAWGLHERGREEVVKVVDERLGSCVDIEQAVRVLQIGLSCSLSENNGRPSMEDVVQFLNMQKQMPELPARCPAELLT